MSGRRRYRVVVEDRPPCPAPNRVVVHTDRLELARLAEGAKT